MLHTKSTHTKELKMNMIVLKNLIDEEGIIFSYSGTVSQPILSSIAETIESELKNSDVDQKIIQNIFAIFTEQMHNIMSYSKERISKGNNRFESPGISVVGFDKERQKYFVESANIMESANKDHLIVLLDKINALNKDQLRAYYRVLRREGSGVHKRGAGLGFLEMAKKSSELLEYNITPLDSGRSFFEIKTFI